MEEQRNYDKARSTESDTRVGRGPEQTKQEGHHQNKGSQEGEETPIYLTGDATLQTPEEAAHDHNKEPIKDDVVRVSRDDLHETNADRRAGSDRAGTSERKNNTVETTDIDLDDINANKKAREEDAESSGGSVIK
jgi:hypothetical protein